MSENKNISTNVSIGLQPSNFQELKALAIHMGKSGFLGVRNESEAITLMMLAQQDGKNVVQACMDYHIIKGKPALTSQAILVRFQNAGGKIQYIERTEEKVVIEFWHKDSGKLTVEWNMEKAQKAGLAVGKDNWTKYPTQMLTARCISEGVRALYPACLGGVYSVEERQEFENDNVVQDIVIQNNQTENIIDIPQQTEWPIDIDYTVCPVKANKGKKWSELDTETLEKAIEYFENMYKGDDTAQWLEALYDVMNDRDVEAVEAKTEVIEPKVETPQTEIKNATQEDVYEVSEQLANS